MERPKEMRVTKREAKALLATGGWREDPELAKAAGFDAYRNARGQSLVLLPGRLGADICDDRDAMLAYCQRVRDQPPTHILKGRFPYGRSFPREVPRLIDQLAEETGLDRSVLDCTEASLERVERTFRRKGGARSFLEEKKFPAVVAYVGEVLRHEALGEWVMERSGEVWEPWVVAADGRRFAPFGIAYKQLIRGRGGSIRGATAGNLQAHLLSGPFRDTTGPG